MTKLKSDGLYSSADVKIVDDSGNAVTATKLATARTIGGVSFDGTANIDLSGVNIAGNQNTSGSSGSCGGNAATATKLATARTIGGVSFDGSAAINLPGVNAAGNQNTTGSSGSCTGSSGSCTGNAATATKLATARYIGGVSFDGTANIVLTVSNDGVLEFGYGLANKEVNAGKIGYGTFTDRALDIVGAGSSAQNRVVRIFDKLGIGTDEALFPLHIYSNSVYNSFTSWIGFTHTTSNGGGVRTGVANSGVISIYASDTIYSKGSFLATSNNVSSDIRIKKDIELQNLNETLNIIKKLKPKIFKYIDVNAHGDRKTCGFIAQDVEEIMPTLVKNQKLFIPSIYSVANVDVDGFTVTILNSNSSTSNFKIEKNFENNIIKIEYLDISNNSFTTNVKQIIDEKTFVVEDQIKCEKIFIMGHEIEDFKVIDTNQILSLNTGSIIELEKQLNETKDQLNETKDQLNETKDQLNETKDKITNLENKLNEILKKMEG